MSRVSPIPQGEVPVPLAPSVENGCVPSPTAMAFTHSSFSGAAESGVMHRVPSMSSLEVMRWTRTRYAAPGSVLIVTVATEPMPTSPRWQATGTMEEQSRPANTCITGAANTSHSRPEQPVMVKVTSVNSDTAVNQAQASST